MRDVGIADRLRARGLKVVEVDGWRDRGSDSFDPKGSVDHHTGGAASGNAPSLGVCINGRADLPGPLCNVMVGRDNTCYVVAAGKANHAGKGGWQGLVGNSTMFGVERENVGGAGEMWRPDQTATAFQIHAALIEGLAKPNPALVCEHKEWAPGRKNDAHTITGEAMRAGVASALLGGNDFMALSDEEQKEMLNLTRQIHAVTAKSGYIEKIVNAEQSEAGVLADIAKTLKDHFEDLSKGGGFGEFDEDALAEELADALAARLATKK